MIPTIKDTPYVGEFECHYRTTNACGEEITGDVTGIIARDSSGRSVQQYSSNPFGDLVPPGIAIILDPVTQMLHVVDRESSTTLASSPVPTGFSTAPVPIDGVGVTSLTLVRYPGPNDTFIGEKVIEGMSCRGYRRLGRRIQEIEFWVADELQDTILASISAVGFESSFGVHDIRQREPNPELLAIPVLDERDGIIDCYFAPL
jgi:hypothetical protein